MNKKFCESSKYSRKEVLSITVQKKRESETKALRIVETLLEDNVSIEWLLENMKYIAQSHLQDAIEERAIAKLCGYPICTEPLGQLPRQKFHISTKTNKVYDITERKHFCSNYCYKAAQYLKGQLLTSPVWLRDNEIMPNFHLLPYSSPGGKLGQELEFGHDPKKMEECSKSISEINKTVALISNAATVIQPHNTEVKTKDKTKMVLDAEKICCNQENDSNSPNPNLLPRNTNCLLYSKVATKSLDSELIKGPSDEMNKCQRKFEDSSVGHVKSRHKSQKNSKQNPNQVNFVSRIEKCLNTWFTLDSLFCIYGNDKVKDMMNEKQKCLKEYYKGVKLTSWEPVTQEKYMVICKKLNVLEIENESKAIENIKNESKPLPNYEKLKEDATIMELKVREFYQPKPIVKLNTNPSKTENEAAADSSIPLVDLHAQNALRRRIVLDRLQHVLPDLLRTFGPASRDISGDVRCLVTTFSLGADNIMFKPAEWNLIGLIILKMLSMKDVKLKTLMETQMAQKYASMILMGFQLDGGYLERLMTWLTDLDNLLDKI